MERVTMLQSSAILLIVFSILAAIDGLWLHLWRYRLHERPASAFEHLTHTWHAVLFVPILVLLFRFDSGGGLLWVAVATLVLDLGAVAADVISERESRRFQGGLPGHECVLHLAITIARAAALALVLAAKPAAAWNLTGALLLADTYPPLLRQTASWILPGTVAVALLHVALALSPELPRRAAGWFCVGSCRRLCAAFTG